jgi:hypothetical protein
MREVTDNFFKGGIKGIHLLRGPQAAGRISIKMKMLEYWNSQI